MNPNFQKSTLNGEVLTEWQEPDILDQMNQRTIGLFISIIFYNKIKISKTFDTEHL